MVIKHFYDASSYCKNGRSLNNKKKRNTRYFQTESGKSHDNSNRRVVDFESSNLVVKNAMYPH